MTRRDVLEHLQIPAVLLEEYACLPLQDFTADQGYSSRDIERLSLMLTLHEIDFSREEVRRYMCLLLSEQNTDSQRLAMLDRRRADSLRELRRKETQLDQLDYLRYEIQKRRGRPL